MNNMKSSLSLITFLVLISVLFAQNANEINDAIYRRSSLCTILIETEDFLNKELVLSAYSSSPFPDKYDNHDIGIKSFDPDSYPLTEADLAESVSSKGKASGFLRSVASDATGGMIDDDGANMQIILKKFIDENRIANKLVAKWFNRKDDGTFDMNLVSERGRYDATELQSGIASASVRGLASLGDAGEELIQNTFVVFHKMNYVSNEVAAAVVRESALAAAAKIKNPVAKKAAEKAAEETYNRTKDGYTVGTTSYLYRLVWNDSVSTIFYSEYWIDDNSPNPQRKELFDNSDLFNLEFIGKEKAIIWIAPSILLEKPEHEVIQTATIRSIDKSYSKLQKNYDVFKTKTPLFSGSPITAKIGMKEGLEGGEVFEVLMQKFDPSTGRTKYDRIGKITVNPDQIWDNRYNAGEWPEDRKADIEATLFDGGDKYYAGMLIREIKE